MKNTKELKKMIVEQLNQLEEKDNRFLAHIYVIIKVHLESYNRDK